MPPNSSLVNTHILNFAHQRELLIFTRPAPNMFMWCEHPDLFTMLKLNICPAEINDRTFAEMWYVPQGTSYTKVSL